MNTLRHGIVVLFYALPALALGIWLPQWLSVIDRELAIGIGVGVLLLGGLLHETRARLVGEERLGAHLLEARQTIEDLRDDLLWTRRELAVLTEALEAIGREGLAQRPRRGRAAPQEVMADALDAVARWDQSGRAVEEVMAEVKALKSLVAQVTRPGSAPDKLAAEPPPRTGAKWGGKRGGKQAAGAAADPLILAPLPEALDEDAVLDAVRAALRDDRVGLVLQPVVSLPARKHHFYEAFSRLRTAEGRVLLPEQFLPVAARKGQITAIDNMILLRCIQLVRRVQKKGEDLGFFCNVAPHTLRDHAFVADLLAFLEQNPDLAHGMIFEFAYDVFVNQSEEDRRLVQQLHAIGCRLSVDQVPDLDVDVSGLGRQGVRFLKAEARVVMDAAAESFDAPGRFKTALARAGLALIVDKIETEAQLLELLDHEIDYGQGFLFGEPRPAKLAA